MDKKELRLWSVQFGNVHFRGNKKLEERLMSLDLERVDDVTTTSLVPGQRSQQALRYLDEYKYLNHSLYMKMNGCSHSTAIADLQKLTDEGFLKRLGSGKAVLYVKGVAFDPP